MVPSDATRSPDHDELASFARARLAGFKVPAHWYDVTELPLNHAGKLLRPKLLELYLNAIARS